MLYLLSFLGFANKMNEFLAKFTEIINDTSLDGRDYNMCDPLIHQRCKSFKLMKYYYLS